MRGKEPGARCKAERGPDMSKEDLLQLSLPEACAAVRDYLIAASAKDCSIMLCMQHLVQSEKTALDQPPQHSSCMSADMVYAGPASGSDAACKQQASSDTCGPLHDIQSAPGRAPVHDMTSLCSSASVCWPAESPVGIQGRFCSADGLWHGFALVVVDLDQKAAAKIPKHYALDLQMMQLHAKPS